MTPQPRTCQAPHCDRPTQARGYCPRHYRQVYKYGHLTPERENIRNPEVCIVEGCSHKPIAKGYCYCHYQQIRRHGRLIPEREYAGYGRVGCIVEGCEGKHAARGYCKKHYQQWHYAQRKAKREA